MADFISGFWNMYVMVLVTLSILFCVFVLVSNMTKREKGEVGLHGHVWDETLAEYNNPLPRWWMYLFWITIVFAVVYLAIYPGFGATATRAAAPVGSTTRDAGGAGALRPVFAKYLRAWT
jgi:cytochrome c oxidase cbb3-type subunit 3